MTTNESIAALAPLTPVTLTFGPEATATVEPALLVSTTGRGADFRATFRSRDIYQGMTYDWEAYMYEGRLSYGTSAEQLAVAL